MGISESFQARDTPSGRKFEAKVIFFDCLILVVGCAGLAVSFSPLIYIAAIGHVVANFFQAPVKWLWPLLEALTVAIAAVVFFGALYLVQVYYYGFPPEGVVAYLKTNWVSHLATAIVAAGIISNLFTLPGITDQLVEYKNRQIST
jgi:hypothetical protein